MSGANTSSRLPMLEEQGVCRVDYEHRPSFNELKDGPWCRNVAPLLEGAIPQPLARGGRKTMPSGSCERRFAFLYLGDQMERLPIDVARKCRVDLATDLELMYFSSARRGKSFAFDIAATGSSFSVSSGEGFLVLTSGGDFGLSWPSGDPPWHKSVRFLVIRS